jgi:carboxypeptidase Q
LKVNRPRAAITAAVIGTVLSSALLLARQPDRNAMAPYRDAAARIVGEALIDDHAWQRLASLTDTFGHRLSGSQSLEAAIQWAVREMKLDGLENVRTEPVMVPKWVRGRESAEVIEPIRHPLVMLGLGGSVGTPPEGLQAEALVVTSYADLDTRGRAAVQGKIIVYNVPFTNYGETVAYRVGGASRAAALGAVGVLLRSVGTPGLMTPHTGVMAYTDNVPRIPAAAITLEDALRLQRIQDRGQRLVVRLSMEAKMLPDAESANVVAEIRGRDLPDEYVVLGGHMDSWDVGTGATDDGGGCVAAWEAVRILKRLNLRPRRTIRVVLWVNEENGGRGGAAYRDRHLADLARHVLMIEADGGVFRPLGFGFSGPDTARATVTSIAALLDGIEATRIGASGGGSDIGPSVQAGTIPSMSLDVDGTRYFELHHTAADTIDKIDRHDLARCVAAMAVMSYVVAELPFRLGQ